MEIAILIAQLLLKFGPDVTRQIVLLIQVDEPTQAKWDEIFALAREKWKDYVPPTPPVP